MKGSLILTFIIFSIKYCTEVYPFQKIVPPNYPAYVTIVNSPPINVTPNLTNYTLFFKDDFDGKDLDMKKWNYYRKGDVVGNLIYTPANASLKNGKLLLTTNKIGAANFSGVDINSKTLFKYGYYEIKARLPKSIGVGAAFWFFPPNMPQTYAGFNPATDGVEIDVFEYSPAIFETMIYSLHWNGYDFAKGAQVSTQQENIPGISKGYHTFALEWTPTEYVVYIDGKERIRTNKIISRTASTLILGFGTGGFGGTNYAGPWPDTFAIDYVKVYKRKPEVRIYGDSNGNGWVSKGLKPGRYTTAALVHKAVANNEASSFEIPKGWVMKVFDGDNFTGDTKLFTHDTGILSDFFNDKISSVIITIK